MKKLIGRGAFSRAYLLEDGETVEIISRDNVKECAAVFGLADSEYFPKITRIDSNYPDKQKYRMEYFPKVRSLKNSLSKNDYKLYKELRKIKPVFSKNTYDLPDLWREQFQAISNDFEECKNALLEAIDSLQNYGHDIGFEISPRNVAVKNGKLVLLDVFFFRSQLNFKWG